MARFTHRCTPVIAAALIAAGSGSFVSAVEPETHDIQSQINDLQAQLEQLKAQQAQAQTAAVDATVERVLNEADRRTQLMQVEGFTAGWNKGKFVLQSADGNYVLNPGLQFQFRYVANSAENAEDDGDDRTENGFEVRRMKLSFEGNAITPKLKYKFQWAAERNSGDFLLEDAWIDYTFAEGWSVQAGQFKDPIFHEEIVSSKRQLAVDRSMLNEVLGGGVSDYIQGVGLTYKANDQFSVQGIFHDGINSDNTNYIDAGGSAALGVASPDYGVAVRAEYVVFGNAKSYGDFSAHGNKEDLLVIGGGADYTEAGDNDLILHTVDAQWEIGKLALYGAAIGAYRDGDENIYDYGFLAQAGYMLNDKYEVFGRYDVIFLDDDGLDPDEEDTLHEITLGVNYFMAGHNAKITVDGTYLPNGAPGLSGLGFVAGEDDEFVLRGQFQLAL